MSFTVRTKVVSSPITWPQRLWRQLATPHRMSGSTETDTESQQLGSVPRTLEAGGLRPPWHLRSSLEPLPP